MKKLPLAVLVISCLLIATGILGIAFHLHDFRKPFQPETAWITLLRLLAIVSGVFMLMRKDWARWLALIWIGFHVVLAFYHSLQQVAIHVVVFALFAYFLLRPEARAYFRQREEAGH